MLVTVGGIGSGPASMEILDLQTLIWRERGDVSLPLEGVSSVPAGEDTFLLVGGGDGVVLGAEILRFDPNSETLEPETVSGPEKRNLAALFVAEEAVNCSA